MSNIFKDRFTGRIIKSIDHVYKEDEVVVDYVSIRFVGTEQELRLFTNTDHAEIHVDDDKLTTLDFTRIEVK